MPHIDLEPSSLNTEHAAEAFSPAHPPQAQAEPRCGVREMQVDWWALHSAFQMNMPEVRCFFDLTCGRVLKLPPGDPNLAQVLGEPQRFLAIGPIPSREQYQWLERFIRSIKEDGPRERIEAAINGKGAFRRFKDILLTMPNERRRWFEYRDKMMQLYTAEFLRQNNIVAENEAPWGAIDLPEEAISHLSPLAAGPVLHGDAPGMPTVPQAAPPPVPQRQPTALTEKHELEALRDFLIEYADSRTPEAMVNPLQLEELASQIGKRFFVRSLHS